ncbi:MAG: tetratricopeptide repeat protein [Planctomycetota bacterium]|nr:tetratricopeptide repeat protein [Planctomycetota bacterium]
MRGRVNTKFVVLLIGIIVVITLTLGGYWYMVIRTSATELVARGEAAAAQGNWTRAAEQYFKALRSRDNDPVLLVKFADVLQKVEVTTPFDATQTLTSALAYYNKSANLDPTNAQTFDKLMTLYMSLGRDLRDPSSWDQMLQKAQLALTSNPNSAAARKYRGIAQVERMLAIDVAGDDRKIARQDLEASLKAIHDDQDVAVHLAIYCMLEARLQDRPGGQPALAAELRKLAVKTTADAVARDPQDLRRLVDHVSLLREAGQATEAQKMLAAVESALIAKPEPVRCVIDAANLLMTPTKGATQADIAASRQRAQTLLRAAVKANPAEPRIALLLAQSVNNVANPTEAAEIFDRVGSTPLRGTSIEVLQQRTYRANANISGTMLILGQAEAATDPAAREALLKKAELVIKQIETDSPQAPAGMVLAGRVAMLRSNFAEAVVRLDKASAAYHDSDPEVLLLSARARAALKENGAAIDRLTRLLTLRPDFVPARLEMAQLHLQLRQNEDASRQIEAVLRVDPKDTRALLLKAALLSQTDQREQAIKLLRQLNSNDTPEIAQAIAQIYASANQKDEAIRTLEAHLEVSPKDVRSLSMLIRLGEPTDRARVFLEAAAKAGGDANTIAILQAQLAEGKVDDVKTLEKIIEQETDPFQKALDRYSLFRRTNRKDEALASLAEAAKLKPDHAQVVEMQFTEAVTAKDWPAAEGLAARAAKLDLDQAQGAFYQGRLEAARGRYDQAESLLNRALAARPIGSDNWRLLGDVLRAKNDMASAAKAYSRAIEQRPDNVEAIRNLAIAQAAQGLRTQALTNLRNAYRLAPQDAALSATYLAYEGQYGDAELAVKLYRQNAKARPDDASVRRSLALLLARLGRQDEAVQTADELFKADPVTANAAVAATVRAMVGRAAEGRKILEDHVAGLGSKVTAGDYVFLARFIVSIGQLDAAEPVYQKAVQLEDTKTRPATRELADVYFDRGQSGKAVELYQQLLKADPKEKMLAHRCVEALTRAGRLDDAEALLKRIVADFPPDGGTALLEALIAAGRKDRPRALAALNRAVQLDPDRAVVYYERAGLLALDPSTEQAAVGDLRKAIELDPGLDRARRALANLLIRRDELDEATQQITMLLERSPQDMSARAMLGDLYLRSRQFTPLKRLLEESARLSPNDPAWPRLAAASARLEGKNDVAEQRLREALKLAPGPVSLAELADFLLSAKKPAAVVELLRNEGKSVTGNPGLLTLQARALAATGDANQAATGFGQALDAAVNAAQVNSIAGAMAASLGRERAVALLEAQPQGPRRFGFDLALANLDMTQGHFADALARLKKITPPAAGSPDRDLYDRLLATAYHQTADLENAQAAYRRILQTAPDDATILNNLAYLLSEDLNRPADGLPMAERAAQVSPNNAQFLDTLGWIQWRAGQADNALNTLRRSVGRTPLAANNLHLAEVLLARGDRPTAVKTFETSLRLAEQAGDRRTAEAATKRLKELGAKDKS